MNNLAVTEFKNIRVLTTQQLAESYEASADTITRNFNRNRDRYKEGKHYICLEGDDLRTFRANGQIDLSPNINKFYLWTEKGAFLHAKSLNTDKAWEVYDILVDTYFRTSRSVSPSLQMLQGMLDQLIRQDAEIRQASVQSQQAAEQSQQAIETTQNIKNTIIGTYDDWRDWVRQMVSKIQKGSNMTYQDVYSTMYDQLEKRAKCRLSVRVDNQRKRMALDGATKTNIASYRTLDTIADDQRLKEIFSTIVKEYAIRYVA